MNLLKVISDHGNPIASNTVKYGFGWGVGIGGGTVQAAVPHMTDNPVVAACAEVAPDWLIYAPVVGVASLLIKNTADFIYRRIEHKHKMREINEDNLRKKQTLDKSVDTE